MVDTRKTQKRDTELTGVPVPGTQDNRQQPGLSQEQQRDAIPISVLAELTPSIASHIELGTDLDQSDVPRTGQDQDPEGSVTSLTGSAIMNQIKGMQDEMRE